MNLWERQPSETAKAYAAFLLYRDLPAVDRTIVAAVVEHRKLGGKASVRNWETWASRYNWRERGLASDSDLAFRRRERMAKEVERAQDDAAVTIRATLDKVKERIEGMDPDGVRVLGVESPDNAAILIRKPSPGTRCSRGPFQPSRWENISPITVIPVPETGSERHGPETARRPRRWWIA